MTKPGCDLDGLYGDLAKRLFTPPVLEDGFVLSRDVLPMPPDQLISPKIIVMKSTHRHVRSVAEVSEDLVLLHADRPTLVNLGLWVISMVFHAKPEKSVLHLQHEASQVSNIVCHYDHEGNAWGESISGYKTVPRHFHYYFEEPARFPFSDLRYQPDQLLRLFLTDPDGSADSKYSQPQLLNTLIGFGPELATVRFAQLLLDIGGSTSTDPNFDIDLETDFGFGGVSPGSVELQIVTPGTYRWAAVAGLFPCDDE